MKNYNQWMNTSDTSEDLVYEMAEKNLVKINNVVDYEVIINDANEWQKDVDLIWLISKPLFTPSMGDFIEYKGLSYLNVYMPEERETYWSSKARLCNSTFPIQSGKTTVLLGKDKFGRAITDDAEAIEHVPCIVESKYYFRGMNEQITLPSDNIAITLTYTESPSIELNKVFDMYKSKFKITFVDYSRTINGKGIVTITGERVSK